MARPEPADRNPTKLELVATLDRTRASLSKDLGGVGRALDLGTRFRRSYASGSWRWLAGALVVGVVAGLRFMAPSSSPSSKSTPAPKAGNSAMLANIAGVLLRQVLTSAAQPALSRILGQEIDKWLSAVLRKP
jgi:hypothetical protein